MTCGLYLRLKLQVDYADKRSSNFVIEYLRENENIREIVLACSCGAQVKSFKQKKYCRGRKSGDSVQQGFVPKNSTASQIALENL